MCIYYYSNYTLVYIQKGRLKSAGQCWSTVLPDYIFTCKTKPDRDARPRHAPNLTLSIIPNKSSRDKALDDPTISWENTNREQQAKGASALEGLTGELPIDRPDGRQLRRSKSAIDLPVHGARRGQQNGKQILSARFLRQLWASSNGWLVAGGSTTQPCPGATCLAG